MFVSTFNKLIPKCLLAHFLMRRNESPIIKGPLLTVCRGHPTYLSPSSRVQGVHFFQYMMAHSLIEHIHKIRKETKTNIHPPPLVTPPQQMYVHELMVA